jgi:hypothetical protein
MYAVLAHQGETNAVFEYQSTEKVHENVGFFAGVLSSIGKRQHRAGSLS